MKTSYPKFLIVLTILILSACNIKNKKTTLSVIDPDRHYYPILQGQELDIQYEIQNTGNEPLFIHDIQASCGCIEINKSSLTILPVNGKGFIRLKYNSTKNTGYVKQYVTLYANLIDSDQHTITFDLHVVPHAQYIKDYEELFREYQTTNAVEKELVEGPEYLKYYIDRED